jgi:phosphotransferase system  glucose/maltose/N-acetylglucosamine-specific IIC component
MTPKQAEKASKTAAGNASLGAALGYLLFIVGLGVAILGTAFGVHAIVGGISGMISALVLVLLSNAVKLLAAIEEHLRTQSGSIAVPVIPTHFPTE